MNIEKFYEAIEGDYKNTLKRLGSKELIEEFIYEFSKDETFSQLCEAYEAKDVEKAFLASHTLKGICANLGLTKLYSRSSELTDVLRKKEFPTSDDLFNEVVNEYNVYKDVLKNN